MSNPSKYGDSRKRKPSSGVSTPEIIEALEKVVEAYDTGNMKALDEAIANAKRVLAQRRKAR
jgi:hypothetical protein